MYERDSERVLLFLARRTLDADVALELTAGTFRAGAVLLAAAAGVDAGAGAGLAVLRWRGACTAGIWGRQIRQ
jgi:hypothetical protein